MHRRPCSKAITSALVALLLTSCARDSAESVSEDAAVAPILAAGATIASDLQPGNSEEFAFQLASGDFLEVAAQQVEIDFSLELWSPAGELVVKTDRPIGHTGPELLLAIAEDPGTYRLRLVASEKTCTDGNFVLSVGALRPATETDRGLVAASRRMIAADAARRNREASKAIELFEQVRANWLALDADALLAETEHRIGSLHRGNYGGPRRLEEAESSFRSALAHALEAGDLFWQMLAHHGIATVLMDLDRLGEAQANYQATLALAEKLNNRFRQAQALGLLSQIAQRQGRIQQALDLVERALGLWSHCDSRDRVRSLHNLATLHAGLLGRPRQALPFFKEAAKGFEQLGNNKDLATVHNQWGQALQRLGELEEARSHFEQALELRQQLDDRCQLAVTHIKLALLDQEDGKPGDADEHAREALRLVDTSLEGTSCQKNEPTVRLNLGDFHLARHPVEDPARGYPTAELDRAEAAYAASLPLFERRGDRTRRAAALTGLAKVRWAAKPTDAAEIRQVIALGRRGIELVEAVRGSVDRSDLRTSFFAMVQELFGITIEALMAAGEAQQAFELAEQGRARTFRDRLMETGTEIRRHAAPDLLEREAELLGTLQSRIRRRLRLLNHGQTDRALDRLIASVEAELETVYGEMRRLSPRYAELALPTLVQLRRIQDQLEPDSLVLETRLGKQISFLWAVTHDSLLAFELPPRAEIKKATGAALKHLTVPRPWRANALCSVSRKVLGPVAHLLRDRRLILVLDGDLERLPFAALPTPEAGDLSPGCDGVEPLVVDHEIVYLPSAEALIGLRERAPPATPEGQLAVFADPVYEVDDARMPATSRRGAQDPSYRLKRLPGTRREAEIILGYVDPDRSWAALGFDANRAEAISSKLRDYRLLHFATHALIDPEQPACSGLVLSQFGHQGQPTDGRIYAYEIYNLELNADLVTLSACSTGIGPWIPGEGLVSGLARAFLYAGSSRVVVSLWDVHDGATSELMGRFYDELLGQGLAPARALQKAQVEMLRLDRPPFAWSGFVLQGDWRAIAPFDS